MSTYLYFGELLTLFAKNAFNDACRI